MLAYPVVDVAKDAALLSALPLGQIDLLSVCLELSKVVEPHAPACRRPEASQARSDSSRTKSEHDAPTDAFGAAVKGAIPPPPDAPSRQIAPENQRLVRFKWRLSLFGTKYVK
jgi:hypothetical protein